MSNQHRFKIKKISDASPTRGRGPVGQGTNFMRKVTLTYESLTPRDASSKDGECFEVTLDASGHKSVQALSQAIRSRIDRSVSDKSTRVSVMIMANNKGVVVSRIKTEAQGSGA